MKNKQNKAFSDISRSALSKNALFGISQPPRHAKVEPSVPSLALSSTVPQPSIPAALLCPPAIEGANTECHTIWPSRAEKNKTKRETWTKCSAATCAGPLVCAAFTYLTCYRLPATKNGNTGKPRHWFLVPCLHKSSKKLFLSMSCRRRCERRRGVVWSRDRHDEQGAGCIFGDPWSTKGTIRE